MSSRRATLDLKLQKVGSGYFFIFQHTDT